MRNFCFSSNSDHALVQCAGEFAKLDPGVLQYVLQYGLVLLDVFLQDTLISWHRWVT